MQKKFWSFWNLCLGNLFEHYDTALFGFLSPFLAPLLFPKEDPMTALIWIYAMIPLGMIARPLGALFFGYIGDRYGRERALFFSLMGMAIASGGIAISPTYAKVGAWAPLLFCLGRGMQNFCSAGETMGGAIFLLEQTPLKKHDELSGWYSASAIGGHLLASWAVFFLSAYGEIGEQWRWLYVAGCVTVLFASSFRRYKGNSLSSAARLETGLIWKQALWSYWRPFLWIMISAGFAHACYSMALIFMNGFVPLVTEWSRAELMKINTYLLIIDFIALPFFGNLASKISRERVMRAAILGVLLFAVPAFCLLKGASLVMMIGIRTLFVLFGVAFFAPFHAWVQTLVPAQGRYLIISFGYAIGAQLLGSSTAAWSLWCFQKTGAFWSVAGYWMLLASACWWVLWDASKKKEVTI